MPLLGLIGYPLAHSFSRDYFTKKFRQLGLSDHEYREFPLPCPGDLPDLVRAHPSLSGLNVTTPHKVTIIPYLDWLDTTALRIGAVNTIRIDRGGGHIILEGYNTDAYGFMMMYRPLHRTGFRQALILGTGGAARAVRHVFDGYGVRCLSVSRQPSGPDQTGYDGLDEIRVKTADIIVNATPVGMFPHTGDCPVFPYEWIHPGHVVIDLIYNPVKTLFLQKAEDRGAMISNGLEMFHHQADKSWELWTE